MKEIVGFYNETGNFETYVGDIMIINANIVLPIYNSQIMNHPLNTTNKIIHLDYCYYVFKNVLQSKRDVYDNSANLKFTEMNYINTLIQKNEINDFLLELLDFKGDLQYWNWVIKAETFSIIVEENYELRKTPYSYNEMSIDFFERNHYEVLKRIIKS